MRTRIERLEHPRIHVQTPPSRTAHLVGNVLVESIDQGKGEYVVGSTVIMVEYRDEHQRVFAGRQHHRLRELSHRAEARRPHQLRLRLRGDGRADLVSVIPRRKNAPLPRPLGRCERLVWFDRHALSEYTVTANRVATHTRIDTLGGQTSSQPRNNKQYQRLLRPKPHVHLFQGLTSQRTTLKCAAASCFGSSRWP